MGLELQHSCRHRLAASLKPVDSLALSEHRTHGLPVEVLFPDSASTSYAYSSENTVRWRTVATLDRAIAGMRNSPMIRRWTEIANRTRM